MNQNLPMLPLRRPEPWWSDFFNRGLLSEIRDEPDFAGYDKRLAEQFSMAKSAYDNAGPPFGTNSPLPQMQGLIGDGMPQQFDVPPALEAQYPSTMPPGPPQGLLSEGPPDGQIGLQSTPKMYQDALSRGQPQPPSTPPQGLLAPDVQMPDVTNVSHNGGYGEAPPQQPPQPQPQDNIPGTPFTLEQGQEIDKREPGFWQKFSTVMENPAAKMGMISFGLSMLDPNQQDPYLPYSLGTQLNRSFQNGLHTYAGADQIFNKPDPLRQYEARKQIDYKYATPERDPIQDYRKKKEIDKDFGTPKVSPDVEKVNQLYEARDNYPEGSPRWNTYNQMIEKMKQVLEKTDEQKLSFLDKQERVKSKYKSKPDRAGIYSLPNGKSISHSQAHSMWKAEQGVMDNDMISILSALNPEMAEIQQEKMAKAQPFDEWMQGRFGIDVYGGAPGRPLEPRGVETGNPLPKSKSDLKVGTVYQTAKGLARWNGTAFEPVE